MQPILFFLEPHLTRAKLIALALMALMFGPDAAATQERPLLQYTFSDHAVLQRDKPITVWGWAAPRERVSVMFAGARVRTRAATDGMWRATLPARHAGGPHTLFVRAAGGASQSVADILMGDVYLCSGQSNMEFPARGAAGGGGADDPNIRLYRLPLVSALTPQRMFATPPHWTLAAGQANEDFSAVCLAFAREVKGAAGAPIGLIQSAWGGTRIESWLSAEALRSAGGFNDGLDAIAAAASAPAGARARYSNSIAAWWAQHDPGARAGWGEFGFDNSNWHTIALAGGSWENSDATALASFDGTVWFRTEFSLTAQQAAQAGELTLGPIDDIDMTILNGVVVGGGSNWQAPRVYAIPAGALRAGRNTLAVSVLDTIGGGGLWGGPETRALRFADGSSLPLGQNWRYKVSSNLWDLPPPPPHAPWDGQDAYSGLYNAMIAPLEPYGLRGVLWYQGESNVAAPDEYARLLPAMMQDWRRGFAAPELPFLIVQLADYGAPTTAPQRKSWGALRDAQRRVAAADAHAGLVVTIDIGDRFDIHPTQKTIVGRRLALVARRLIYGEAVIDSGPTPVSTRTDGNAVVVEFAHGPLIAYSAGRPTAFELCDGARNCRYVDASVDGMRVLLDARGMTPAFVRYCWGDAPICNLYNEADLPAVPFEAAVRP